MRPEKRHLIHDLLDGQRDDRRTAILRAGGHALSRRRWRRVALRGFAAAALLAVAAFSLQELWPRGTRLVSTPPSESRSVAKASPQGLTDAQLMALFPDTPVGLITLKDGRKRLVFPRPGDEEHFIKGPQSSL